MTFVEKNLGRYAVRHAGILVEKAFDRIVDAEKWATWNYSSPRAWRIEKIDSETKNLEIH